METTKVCTKCGRELSTSEFYVNAQAKDGLQSICKECKKALMREYNKRRKEESNSQKNGLFVCYSNPELAKFTPRELMMELKMRGFRWEYMLEPQRKIMYDKLK